MVNKGNNFKEAIMRFGFSILAIAGLILAACQTTPNHSGLVPVIFKAGSESAERQRDFDACKIASFKEIPQSMSDGKDVNQGLRGRYIHNCLSAKGYTWVPRPVCAPGQKNPAGPDTTPDAIKCGSRPLDR